jgi:hypothetical protein
MMSAFTPYERKRSRTNRANGFEQAAFAVREKEP